MTDDTFELTRRKALTGLGTIGAASALGGAGTAAFFSDEETFSNNQVVAGALDMKIAWQEHYVDWIGEEADDAHMPSDGAAPTFRLPAPESKPDAEDIGLVVEDGRAFLNGSRDDRENGGLYGGAEDLCGTDADAGERPLIELGDVKPGDFGFGLFRFQLCTNPGKLWLTGGLRSADENGQSEPEADDPDEYGDPDATNPALVELLDAIQVAVGVGTTGDLAASDPADNLFPEPDPDSSVPQPATQFSLREFLGLLEKGEGLPLAGDTDAEQGGGSGRPCFSGETGHYASVVWWLPVNHANELQTDSVTFDLGFYTEQCRHNGTADAFVAPDGDLQSAVDAAAEGDTIEVGAGTFPGTLTIDTPGITLRSVAPRATIEGSDDITGPAVSIRADGVTVEGLDVRNPDGLLGIKIDSAGDTGRSDVTVRCNRVRDVGPTGRLGVTGIIVGQGDHSGLDISNNTIRNLRQDDDGSFATLNGILFDADNDDPGTITDVAVRGNSVRALESTTASLGVVVQHDVETLVIEDNLVANLLAANRLGAGSFTTFAQGINVGSAEATGLDITGNTIAGVVSEDGFFGEDIKIGPGADVAGITVSGNNLLSAVGLNNANGANPTLTAENNYWGSSSGPFEITNNDDDGDVPTGSGEVDLDTVAESAVTENVDFDPFASSSQ